MRTVILVVLLALAVPALASPYFPLVPGAIWTLEDDDPPTAMTLTMAGEVQWHDQSCFPRYETIDGDLVGITYWSVDADGRTLLHGMEYLVGDLQEFYYTPPAVYLDPELQCGESVVSEVNVFEIEESGDHWHGLLDVQVTCIARDPVDTPLGIFPAVTVDPSWTDSPFGAAWRYGHDGVFSFGFGAGPVRIASYASPVDLILVQLENLVTTGVTPTAMVAQIELRAAPNPFNPSTELRFSLDVGGPARLEVFDLRGRRLDVLHAGELAAGRHEFTWQPASLGSGVYLARITTAAGTGTTRLTLVE